MSEQKSGLQLPFGMDCFQVFFLLVLLAVMLFLGGQFFIWPVFNWLRTVKDLSSWVQAIGSLVAIAIAILVPVAIHNSSAKIQKNKDFIQGAMNFYFIKPRLNYIANMVNLMLDAFVEIDKINHMQPIKRSHPAANDNSIQRFAQFTGLNLLIIEDIQGFQFVDSESAIKLSLLMYDISVLQNDLNRGLDEYGVVYTACVENDFKRRAEVILRNLKIAMNKLESKIEF